MNINTEINPNCRATAHLHFSAEDVSKARKKVVALFTKEARLPGFRPGKAPAATIEKRYAEGIKSELMSDLVRNGVKHLYDSGELNILEVLSVKDDMFHDNDGSFSFTVEVSTEPKFELPEYKGIPVKLPRIEVTDADVDHDILHLRERYAEFKDVERAAGKGDCVVISYTVELEGKPTVEVVPDAPEHLRELKSQWFLLDDEENFLPEFYAKLIGVTKGEQRKLDIQLPENVPSEALKEKTLTFNVTCEEVKVKEVPELNEEFVKRIGGEDFTESELRAEVQDGIRRRREQQREQDKTNQVIMHISESLQFDLPQEIVNREAQRRTNDIAMRALRQGVPEETLLQQQEEILGQATKLAQQSVKSSFILSEVARREAIEVSEEQLNQALATMAGRQRKPVKKFIQEALKNGTVANVRENLLLENALEFLKDHAQVEETDPVAEVCEQHS